MFEEIESQLGKRERADEACKEAWRWTRGCATESNRYKRQMTRFLHLPLSDMELLQFLAPRVGILGCSGLDNRALKEQVLAYLCALSEQQVCAEVDALFSALQDANCAMHNAAGETDRYQRTGAQVTEAFLRGAMQAGVPIWISFRTDDVYAIRVTWVARQLGCRVLIDDPREAELRFEAKLLHRSTIGKMPAKAGGLVGKIAVSIGTDETLYLPHQSNGVDVFAFGRAEASSFDDNKTHGRGFVIYDVSCARHRIAVEAARVCLWHWTIKKRTLPLHAIHKIMAYMRPHAMSQIANLEQLTAALKVPSDEFYKLEDKISAIYKPADDEQQ